jgi:hypothetical protein
MPSVVMINALMLNVVTPNVIMLSVMMLKVVAPLETDIKIVKEEEGIETAKHQLDLLITS